MLSEIANWVEDARAFDAPKVVRDAIPERNTRPRCQGTSDLRDEDRVGVGSAHDARRLVDDDAPDIATDLVDLARVDTRTDAKPETGARRPHLERKADGARRPVERREETVTGRPDLLAAVSRDRRPDGLVVAREEITPRALADARRGRRRADEIREDQREEHPLADPDRRRPGPQTLPLERHERLVAEDPAVVPRGDVEHVVRPEIDRAAVLEDVVEPAADDDPRVPSLAPLAADLRLHVGLPAPARLLDRSTDRHVTEPHRDAMRQLAGDELIRLTEVLAPTRHLPPALSPPAPASTWSLYARPLGAPVAAPQPPASPTLHASGFPSASAMNRAASRTPSSETPCWYPEASRR